MTNTDTIQRIRLEAGIIEYRDTGGDGPVIVLAHGVPMDGRCWRDVVPRLEGCRVITPTLPLGGHRTALRPGADLTHFGVAGLLADFLEALELRDVTLVLNDWGGGQYLINLGRTERIGRLVLAACEAFDNFPPGPARVMGVLARIPPLFWLVVQGMRLRAARQAPGGYGGMAVTGVPDDLLRDWFTPAMRDRRVRRDFAAFAASAPPRAEQVSLAEEWARFDKPVLVVWAENDTMMPADHGPRLAALYPQARLEILPDCATLVGFDQPERFAELLREFAAP